MNQPNNWANTTAYGDFTPLELGGHICKICSVTETKSKSTNKDMLVVLLDIAEGEQKGYYEKQYKADTRVSKKWGCSVNIMVEDNEGNTNKAFKTFIDAVEKSNSGFNQSNIWDDKFASYFKNKLIGGVFGREQYENNNGDLKWSTKCVNFRNIESIKKGVEVPNDKLLKVKQSFQMPEFEIVETDDSSLPF